jgi:hypothetical protein
MSSLQRVTDAIQGIKALGGELGAMLPVAQAGLAETKGALDQFTAKLADLEYRMERQQHVTLRLIHDIGTIPLVNANDFDELLALQKQYEAEYDAERSHEPCKPA